jgi:hypothetical protein
MSILIFFLVNPIGTPFWCRVGVGVKKKRSRCFSPAPVLTILLYFAMGSVNYKFLKYYGVHYKFLNIEVQIEKHFKLRIGVN